MSDRQIETLNKIADTLTYKENLYLTFTSNKSQFTTTFSKPHKLLSGRFYEAGLHYFTTSNYQTNIRENNNKFYYTIPVTSQGKTSWQTQTITLEKGAYEIESLNNEIKRQMVERKHLTDMKDSSFNITINLSIFKVAILQDPNKMRVDFNKPNTFRDLLGFRPRELTQVYNLADATAQITTASSILIKCSITQGSYHNGEESNTLFSFPSYVVPTGYKYNILPPTMVYLPVISNVISSITFSVADDNGNLLDFKDENMALAIHIRQI
jgi:hypothetical protein